MNVLRFFAAAAAAMLIAGAAPAEPPAKAPTPPRKAASMGEDPTLPKFISGPEAPYPEAEKALGHHGTVTIVATLGVDGKLIDPVIAESSGAPVLDRISLEAARGALFSPARDAAGKPVERRIRIPYDFTRYRSNEPGGGLVRYGCAMFVQDMDWWRATFPEREWSKHELYLMLRGLTALRDLTLLGAGDMVKRIGRENAAFDRRWHKALAECRKAPDKRLADVIQPEGKMIDRLADAARQGQI